MLDTRIATEPPRCGGPDMRVSSSRRLRQGEPVSLAPEEAFSLKPGFDHGFPELALAEQVIRPGNLGTVREAPRNFHVGLLRPASEELSDPRMLNRPYAHERGPSRPEDASHFLEGPDPVLVGREVMKDGDAQGFIENPIRKGKGRRLSREPFNRLELPRLGRRFLADRQETPRQVD